jgi:hypothetical protein
MSEQNQVPETSAAPEVKPEPGIAPRVQAACDVAAGKTPADPAEAGRPITGAKKDLNSKGRGDQWYRMVYRGGAWRYVSNDRLPNGSFLASDRRASVSGEVFVGEIVVQHDRGGPVDAAWIVCPPSADGKVLVRVEFARRRDGSLGITLPDGSELVLPDPRGK